MESQTPPKKTKLLLLLSIFVLVGCSSTNPERHLQQIGQWIPPGTPQADAIRIMKEHGYDCGPSGRPSHYPEGEAEYSFWHETKILKNTRWFFVRFKDGKVESIEHWGTGNNFFMGKPEKS